MSMKEFIKQNRAKIDRIIRNTPGLENYQLNDNDRRDWIMNDEGLYSWARSEGVKV